MGQNQDKISFFRENHHDQSFQNSQGEGKNEREHPVLSEGQWEAEAK